jgi:putative membrane protein
VASEGFEPQLRLHPLSWLFALLGFVRQFIVPLIAAFFFGARNDPGQWGLIAGIPLLAAALWHQYTFRYGFGPHGLVIRAGFLFRNVRQIDYARIENVDSVRGPLHRLLGVSEVRVETSTGGKPEALIRVLGLRQAAELRDRVFSRARAESPSASAAEPRAEADEPLLQLSTGELVRFGLIDNRGMVLVAASVGVVYQNGGGRVVANLLDAWMPALENFEALGHLVQFALALGLIIGALALVRVLSIILALGTLHDFRLTRHGGDLRIRHGLLTRVSLTLRLPRIQALHQTETLLHRLFRRVSLSMDLAGDGGPEGEQRDPSSKRVRWLAPVAKPAHAAELIAAALPQANLAVPPEWQPLAPGARGRIFRRSLRLAALIAIVPAIWLVRHGALPVAWLLLAVPPVAWWRASHYVRYTRWALTDDVLLLRSGWLTRRLAIAPRGRVQTVRLSESPFDRRAHMATVAIDTAGAGARSPPIRIPYLTREVAAELAAALYRSAAISPGSRGALALAVPDSV